MPRWIAHLDMDAFYASVELLRYPELRGRPVVVGGRRAHQPEVQPDGTRRYALLRDYAGRGVATTSTYEARALGVHSAMGLMKAAALAPDAVLLPADFDEYRRYSRLFKAAVAEVAPVIENRGIDEIYIDLTTLIETEGIEDDPPLDPLLRAKTVAQQIKDRVRTATGLSCSIGITPNKLLSKIASELDKPDGLTLLTHADVPLRIWPLPPRRINGIGPKAAARLDAMGIRTIGELAASDPLQLTDEFGANYAAWLLDAANGRDERPVETHSEPRSISRETTFERDLHPRQDRAQLGTIFTGRCERVADDLARRGYTAKTIAVKLRQDDFKIVTRALTLPAHTQDARAIRQAAGQCLKKCPLDRRLRLLGVRADALCRVEDLPAEGAMEDAQLDLPLAENP